MTLRRAIPAGLLDAGLASLATFVVGLYAVRELDPVSLGGYALFFSAFSTLMVVPSQLVFLPAEIRAIRLEERYRLGVLGVSLLQGAPVAILSSTLTLGVVLVVPDEVAADTTRALLLTAMASTCVSPIQDHIRKLLHIGGRSWDAAAVSATQLVAAVSALAVLAGTDVIPAWHPFGALASANVVSAAVGLVLWLRARDLVTGAPARLGQLLSSGRWLLIAGAAPNLSGFAAASLVAHLASAQALGHAEAARILARPVAVLANGIMSVLGPQIMRSGAERDAVSAKRLGRLYAGLIAGGGSVYLAIAGWDWVGNPLPTLVPNGYVVTGLTATSIAAYVFDRVAGAGAGLHLLGAGRERALGVTESLASLGLVLGGLTAPVTNAFAIPVGYLLMSIVRRVWMRALVRDLYRGAPPEKGTVSD